MTESEKTALHEKAKEIFRFALDFPPDPEDAFKQELALIKIAHIFGKDEAREAERARSAKLIERLNLIEKYGYSVDQACCMTISEAISEYEASRD